MECSPQAPTATSSNTPPVYRLLTYIELVLSKADHQNLLLGRKATAIEGRC